MLAMGALRRSAAAVCALRRPPFPLEAPPFHRALKGGVAWGGGLRAPVAPFSSSSSRWSFPKTQANYAQLSPLSLLKRVERTYPNKVSCVHGGKKFTWKETAERSRRLASALVGRGVKPGDTVAVMLSNTPEMLECHWAIPMTGAVINALNTRLDPSTVSFIIQHSEARFVIVDSEFAPVMRKALESVEGDVFVVDLVDSEAPQSVPKERIGQVAFEALLGEGDAAYQYEGPADEWDAVAVGYTSGTTGDPKGVVTHHRGAYLNALSNVVGWDMAHHPRYLWTLPMFHCNGWCFPWTMAAVGGTSVCVRSVNSRSIYDAIADHGATHLCGAPIVLNMIANAREEDRRAFAHKVRVMTAAAPPSAATLQKMQAQGFDVTHVYGLTETYGPAVVCSWDPDWDSLDLGEQARLRSRQGVNYHVLEDLQVMDPSTMERVPADGQTVGEVMFRGNIVMKGYLKNKAATDKEMAGGWFHSGDLGVMHPDGYIELKDRAKDVIISGGENISSIEVEQVVGQHPAVSMVAAVARPCDKWGETPCVFIELGEGAQQPSEGELVAFCRERMAGYKVPKTFIFCELPKTSTGKIQKFKLRQEAKDMGSL